MKKMAVLAAMALFASSCAVAQAAVASTSASADDDSDAAFLATQDRAVSAMADLYLRLSLEAGTYEDGYIDAYYGPAELRAAAEANPRPLERLRGYFLMMLPLVDTQLEILGRGNAGSVPYSPYRRLRALRGNMVAAETRLRMIGGTRLSFADEARGLFGVEPQPLDRKSVV